jgi:hypothetical protein
MKTIISAILALLLLAPACGSDSKTSGSTDTADTLATDIVAGDDAAADRAAEPEVSPDLTNQASLFPQNPVADDWETKSVTMTGIDDPNGQMTGPYATVFNCLNEEGGWWREYEVPLFGMVKGQLCNIKKTVVPDEDGSYLSVEVTEDLLDPDDPFAELMLFYHMNVVHDYYKDIHGFDGMDFPLEGYVNVTAYLEMENPLEGIPTGWVSLDNAMFVPGESFEALEKQAEEVIQDFLGVEDDLDLPFKNDAIFFFQGPSIDFAYDGDVIYHEYTHAVVGGERLFGYAVDEFGLDASPTAVNEAYADYFACSMMGDPVASEYALAALSGTGRDISIDRFCPEDLFGEEHDDGLMYSSALWDIREALGQEDADTIIFNALLTFHLVTSFEEAAQATIAEAALLEPTQEDAVEAIFQAHGLLGCSDRIRPYADIATDGEPTFVPGTQLTGFSQFSEAAPGFMQYTLEVEEGTLWLRLEVTAEPAGMEGILGSFLGDSDVALSVSVKHDGPITYTLEPDYLHTEDTMVPLEKIEAGRYGALIHGPCLQPGTHHVQLMGRSGGLSMVRTMSLVQGIEPFEGDAELEPNYVCE